MTTGIQIAARLRELADLVEGISDEIDSQDLDITPLEKAVDSAVSEYEELKESTENLELEDDDEEDEDEETE